MDDITTRQLDILNKYKDTIIFCLIDKIATFINKCKKNNSCPEKQTHLKKILLELMNIVISYDNDMSVVEKNIDNDYTAQIEIITNSIDSFIRNYK